MSDDVAAIIENAWKARDSLRGASAGPIREAIEESLDGLDSGRLRVAEKVAGEWHVHQWLKKAVLLSFGLNDMKIVEGGSGGAVWWDKVDSKFKGWDEARFSAAGFRAVPGCIVRRSAFIGRGAGDRKSTRLKSS